MTCWRNQSTTSRSSIRRWSSDATTHRQTNGRGCTTSRASVLVVESQAYAMDVNAALNHSMYMQYFKSLKLFHERSWEVVFVMKCKHKLLQLAYEMCITSRFYMGYNLSYKLCILNSVVVHLGMKIIHTGIADKIPNLCQHVMKNCLDWSLIIPYDYLCSAQSDSKFLKKFEMKKKKKE